MAAQQVVESLEQYLQTTTIDTTVHAMVTQCLKQQPAHPNGLFIKFLMSQSPDLSCPDVAVASTSTADGLCYLAISHDDPEAQQYIVDTGLQFALRELMQKVLHDKPEDILEYLAGAAKQMLSHPPEELR